MIQRGCSELRFLKVKVGVFFSFCNEQTETSAFFPTAERVKQENLTIVCIPTSFQVSTFLLCFLLVQTLTQGIFPLAAEGNHAALRAGSLRCELTESTGESSRDAACGWTS